MGHTSACLNLLPSAVAGHLNDDTLVKDLYEMKVDIIGEMAIQLDLEQPGKKNWRELAAELGVPRRDYLSFGTDPDNKPTEELFKYLVTLYPELTMGKLKQSLGRLLREDVVVVMNSSPSGW